MNEVIWSKNASEELLAIVEYWNNRNNSNAYSEKIRKHIQIAIELIKNNNYLGIQTNIKNVRIRIILKKYYLIYEIDQEQINILSFWDARQNPIKMNFT